MASWLALSIYGGGQANASRQAQAPPPAEPEVQVRRLPYEPAPLFRSESTLVTAGVVVRGAGGEPLAGLPATAFHIFDNNVAQTIATFSEESMGVDAPNAPAPALAGDQTPPTAKSRPPGGASREAPARRPRAIALFFDDLHTSAGDLTRTRLAAAQFVSANLLQQDRLGVFTASGLTTFGFSGDFAGARNAINSVRPHLRMNPIGDQECPRITPEQAYQIIYQPGGAATATALAQAILCGQRNGVAGTQPAVQQLAEVTWEKAREQSLLLLAAIGQTLDALALQPGRRVLVIASAGYVDGPMSEQERQLIEAAHRNDIVIDGLDAVGLVDSDVLVAELNDPDYADFDPGRMTRALARSGMSAPPTYDQTHTQELIDLTDGMAALASATGGQLFWNNNDLSGGFRALTDPPRTSYELGFRPVPYKPDGSYHRLRVKVDGAAVRNVEARYGYLANPAPAADATTNPSEDALIRAALGSDTPQDIGVTAAARVTDDNGKPALSAQVHVDVGALTFTRSGDRSRDEITILLLFCRSGSGDDAPAIAGRKAAMTFALSDATLAKFRTEGVHDVATFALPSPTASSYEIRAIVQEAGTGHMGVAKIAVDTSSRGR